MAVMKPQFGARLIRGHPLAQGLVGCWLMNEGSGTIVYDVSGRDQHGTLTGVTPSASWTNGQSGSAMGGFYPAGEIRISSGILSATTDFTLHSSFYLSSASQSGAVISIGNSNATTGCAIGVGASGRLDYLGNKATVMYNSARDINTLVNCGTGWMSMTLVVDVLGYPHVYLNGALAYEDTGSAPRAVVASSTQIGNNGYSYDYYRFTGIVDLGAVYNRALSQAEVELINLDPYQMFESPSSIKKYWYLPVGGRPLDATHYLPITARHRMVAANMPDSGNTFAADLVIDQALAINYEGGAESFIDGLESDCSDLRIFSEDGLTEIPYGIKQFSQVAGSRKLILGLGIKSSAPLSATSNTTYVMYRGCKGGPFENRTAVVPLVDGFVGYWPLEEDPSGTAPQVYDWTSTNDDGTSAGSMTSGDSVNAVVGRGLDFDGVDDSILVSYHSFGTTITFSVWFLGRSDVAKYMLSKSRCLLQVSPTQVSFWPDTSNTNWNVSATVAKNVWHHLAITQTGTSSSAWLDGSQIQNGQTVKPVVDGSDQEHIGAYGNSGWDGEIDEVSISNVARSAAWIQTYYNASSANDSFWTIGPEGAIPPPGATHYLEVTSDHTKLSAQMPDSGNTFAADLIIDEANDINIEGGALAFIDGLSSDCSDLRVFDSSGLVEVAFGIKQFSQVVGSRKLILGLGIPSTAPLSATSDTTYRLYMGCTGGTFESKSGVVPVADGFVGYWPLEESSGNVYDWTANTKNGTVAGTVAYGQSGVVGNCLSYTAGTADCGADNNKVGITLSAWIRPTSNGVWPTIIRLHNSSDPAGAPGPGLYLLNTSGNIALVTNTGNVTYYRTNAAVVTLNQWQHVVGQIVSTSEFHLFVNGVEQTTWTTPMQSYAETTNPGNICIGGGYGANYFVGKIDEPILSSVARSTPWIASYYAMTSDNDTFWAVGPLCRVTTNDVYQMYVTADAETGIYGPGDMLVRGYRD